MSCNLEQLQRSLSDSLSERDEEQLAAHLNECAECRRRLEELAAESGQWRRVGATLKNEVSGEHQPVVAAKSTLIPQGWAFAGRSGLHEETHPHDFAVDFLQPSSKPDVLGQLNNIEIRAVIGHGGNGIVLKGFQEELNRLVAVKVMAPQLATSAAARKRFAREAQATAAIVHPNVMPILTVHSDGQLPYLVMPYVDCESLQERLDREGQLPTLDILRIAHQVANGLAAAHGQGLVHRDVKPANILLEKSVDRVMLTDFGLARAVDDATLTRTGLIAGTPQYMSPEQARGDAVDTRSDLFSLGSVMYAMATGRPPFRAETSYGILRRVTDEEPRRIEELNSDIPGWLTSLISKLLAKSVDDRFAKADHLAAVLEACIAHVRQLHREPAS
ncbi:MAG: serine/threonine-protein kinase [Planctomycetaceae bacterium]